MKIHQPITGVPEFTFNELRMQFQNRLRGYTQEYAKAKRWEGYNKYSIGGKKANMKELTTDFMAYAKDTNALAEELFDKPVCTFKEPVMPAFGIAPAEQE